MARAIVMATLLLSLVVSGERGVVGLSDLCQPCEKNSDTGGVPGKISSNLSCPVGGEEEVVSGTFAAANDNGIAI